MGCSCIGPIIKIKSNISVNDQLYSNKEEVKKTDDKEENNFQNHSKSLNAKVIIECSNISSSRLSFSDDAKNDDERES